MTTTALLFARLRAGVSTILDATQLLCLDWASSGKRKYWDAARWQLRTLHFRAHAHLPTVSLREVLDRIVVTGKGRRAEVVMPIGTTSTEGVGSSDYYYTIAAITAAVDPCIAIEVGTYLGVGALTMALNSKLEARIFTIDLPGDDLGIGSGMSSTDQTLVQKLRGRVAEALSTHPAGRKVQKIFANSLSIKFSDYTATADLIVIDGGHSGEVVRRDTENALAVIAQSGVIVWDDYWWLYPELVTYLNGLSKELALRRIDDTNVVVYSPAWGR